MTAAERIADAVKDKPDGAYAEVKAGDVRAVCGPRKGHHFADALLYGVRGLADDTSVYQLAAQLAEVLNVEPVQPGA